MKYKKHPKRDALRNYFPLPNEIFALGLCSGEISVYSYLLYCEDRKTFQCWPGYRTIGKALKMSRNTVKKYVEMLEEKQLITTEYTKVVTKQGIKRNGNLRYTIRPIHEATAYFYQKQLKKVVFEQKKAEKEKKIEKHGLVCVNKGVFADFD